MQQHYILRDLRPVPVSPKQRMIWMARTSPRQRLVDRTETPDVLTTFVGIPGRLYVSYVYGIEAATHKTRGAAHRGHWELVDKHGECAT